MTNADTIGTPNKLLTQSARNLFIKNDSRYRKLIILESENEYLKKEIVLLKAEL